MKGDEKKEKKRKKKKKKEEKIEKKKEKIEKKSIEFFTFLHLSPQNKEKMEAN